MVHVHLLRLREWRRKKSRQYWTRQASTSSIRSTITDCPTSPVAEVRGLLGDVVMATLRELEELWEQGEAEMASMIGDDHARSARLRQATYPSSPFAQTRFRSSWFVRKCASVRSECAYSPTDLDRPSVKATRTFLREQEINPIDVSRSALQPVAIVADAVIPPARMPLYTSNESSFLFRFLSKYSFPIRFCSWSCPFSARYGRLTLDLANQLVSDVEMEGGAASVVTFLIEAAARAGARQTGGGSSSSGGGRRRGSGTVGGGEAAGYFEHTVAFVSGVAESRLARLAERRSDSVKAEQQEEACLSLSQGLSGFCAPSSR